MDGVATAIGKFYLNLFIASYWLLYRRLVCQLNRSNRSCIFEHGCLWKIGLVSLYKSAKFKIKCCYKISPLAVCFDIKHFNSTTY